MKSGAVSLAGTAFISTEAFTQRTFKDWVQNRPVGDINRYELASGKIVLTPPAAWEHAEVADGKRNRYRLKHPGEVKSILGALNRFVKSASVVRQ